MFLYLIARFKTFPLFRVTIWVSNLTKLVDIFLSFMMQYFVINDVFTLETLMDNDS